MEEKRSFLVILGRVRLAVGLSDAVIVFLKPYGAVTLSTYGEPRPTDEGHTSTSIHFQILP